MTERNPIFIQLSTIMRKLFFTLAILLGMLCFEASSETYEIEFANMMAEYLNDKGIKASVIEEIEEDGTVDVSVEFTLKDYSGYLGGGAMEVVHDELNYYGLTVLGKSADLLLDVNMEDLDENVLLKVCNAANGESGVPINYTPDEYGTPIIMIKFFYIIPDMSLAKLNFEFLEFYLSKLESLVKTKYKEFS